MPTKACQTIRMMIPHDDVHYHDHYLYHNAPNDDDDDNCRTDVISDDDKENSGNNDNQYGDHIPGLHRGASEDGSNAPTVVDSHSEDPALECHGSSNHGGLNNKRWH